VDSENANEEQVQEAELFKLAKDAEDQLTTIYGTSPSVTYQTANNEQVARAWLLKRAKAVSDQLIILYDDYTLFNTPASFYNTNGTLNVTEDQVVAAEQRAAQPSAAIVEGTDAWKYEVRYEIEQLFRHPNVTPEQAITLDNKGKPEAADLLKRAQNRLDQLVTLYPDKYTENGDLLGRNSAGDTIVIVTDEEVNSAQTAFDNLHNRAEAVLDQLEILYSDKYIELANNMRKIKKVKNDILYFLEKQGIHSPL